MDFPNRIIIVVVIIIIIKIASHSPWPSHQNG